MWLPSTYALVPTLRLTLRAGFCRCKALQAGQFLFGDGSQVAISFVVFRSCSSRFFVICDPIKPWKALAISDKEPCKP